MATSKKKSVKRKVVKKKVTSAASPQTVVTKPSKASLLKAAKLELRIAKAALVQAKRDLASAQGDYLGNPTKGNTTTFRNAPGAVVKANRKVETEQRKVLRLS